MIRRLAAVALSSALLASAALGQQMGGGVQVFPAPGASAAGANPTGCTTGTAANGSATTFLRSDGAPPICSSAALPGSPTTTTQAQGDNSTKIATTAYADGLSFSPASALASRFTPSGGGSRIPITEATATRVGTSQGGLTYSVHENVAWSIYLNNGTGHVNSVAGWTIPCTSLGASCSVVDTAFAVTWVGANPTSADMSDFVIGMSDGTGVDDIQERGNQTGFCASFILGPTVGTPTTVVKNSPIIWGQGAGVGAAFYYPIFFRLKDDGTDIFIYDSLDGINWQLWAEWAVASKGVTGTYTSVFIGMANANSDTGATWDQQLSLYMVDPAASSRTSTLIRPY